MRSDSLTNNASSADAAPAESRYSVVVVVGVLLGLCLIGLTHAGTYLEQHRHGVAVELGAGISDQEEFEEDVNAAPAHRKLGFIGLLAVAAYCYYTSPRDTSIQLSMVLFWMACCLLVVMSSYFWSFGRAETARELVRIIAYAGVAYSFAKRFQPRELLKVLAIMAMVSVGAACLVDAAMGGGPWQPDYRLHGTLHSNLLAHQALIALLIAFALYKTSARPLVWKSAFGAMLAVIILTKTRGALASSLVGLTAIVLIGQSFRSFVMVVSLAGMVLTASALFVVMVGSHAQQRLSETAALGRSEGVGTLTGRIPLWEAVLKESKDNRLKGYGYGAFWNTDRTTKLSKQLDWFPGHSHSAYVQTVLDVGYFGAGMVLMLVVAGLVRSAMLYFATGNPAYRFVFGLLVGGLVDGIVEVSFVYPRELGLFVAIALFMLVVVHPRPTEADTEVADSSSDQHGALGLGWQSVQPAF